MRAIVPLNIAAIRVTGIDDSGITGNFKGRTAVRQAAAHFRLEDRKHRRPDLALARHSRPPTR